MGRATKINFLDRIAPQPLRLYNQNQLMSPTYSLRRLEYAGCSSLVKTNTIKYKPVLYSKLKELHKFSKFEIAIVCCKSDY